MSKHHSGEIVGELTLEYKYSCKMPNKRTRTKWHCLCSCGETTEVLDSNLNSTSSCGHASSLLKKKAKTKDLTGNIYSWLFVEEQAPDRISSSGRHITRWRCLCDCGNRIEADGQELQKGNVKSCGCHRYDKQREKSDLTGKIINSIEVIERLAPKKYPQNHSTYSRWKCKCLECGTIFTAFGNALRRGQISCGCINSKGEYELGKFFSENNIVAEKCYSFDDLLSPLGFPLFFDFAINNDDGKLFLIEYQGIQHYEPQQDHFGDYQREITDPLKKEYCLTHNIPLFEIKYDEDIVSAAKNILKKIYANSVPSSK